MPAKSKKTKSTNSTSNKTSTVTFYPSFQALAGAAKDREAFETPPPRPRTLRSAADVPRVPVQWLWPEKIPLGKVTLLIGDPGLGKTLVALDVAARTSTGAQFPLPSPPFASSATTNQTEHALQQRQGVKERGRQADSQIEPCSVSVSPCLPVSLSCPPTISDANPANVAPGSVLILSANDTIADTIRPRLDAHGADPAKIFFASELTDLRRDVARLEATLAQIPDCRLIIVDPVNAFVGPSDSHFHTIVRKVLAPLAELAAKRKVAVLAVTHLRKNTGRAIQSAAGSMGFVAAARTVWTICRDPADPRRNLLLPVKNNVGPLPAGLAFSIETHPEIDAPVIRWDSLPVATTAEDVGKPQPKPRGPEAEERHQAGEWLRAELADGPRDSFFLIHEGHEHGFSERTLRRALHAIGGQTRKEGFTIGWTWSLVNVPLDATPVEDTSTSSPGTPRAKQPGRFAETWPLRENPDKTAANVSPSPPIRNETCHPSPRPTVEQSIQFLERIESKLKGDEPPPDPHSLTGHPMLDKILDEFRPPLATNNQPRTTNSQQLTPQNKKSARSHSRLPTGTDSWHFTRQPDSCEPAAMHLRDVSAQALDESNTRRREDAV